MGTLKKILTLVAALSLVASLAVGGSIAYLQDTDQAVNTMTLGNVDIEQHEYERVVDENGDPVEGVLGEDFKADYDITRSYKLRKFTQGKPAYPAVYTNANHTTGWDEFQQLWNQVGAPGSNDLFDDSMKNVIDKFVFVENTGKSDAYYRTIVAIEAPEGLAEDTIHTSFNANSRFDYNDDEEGVQNAASSNKFYTVIDGVRYLIYTATYTDVLTPGEVSRPSLLQIYLDPKATNEDCALFGDTWDILVASQAVQAAGFADAATALNTAFGDVSTASHPWMDGLKGDQEPDGAAVVITSEDDLDKVMTFKDNEYNVTANALMTDFPLFSNYTATEAYTFNGNDKTITMVASEDQTFDWKENGTIPMMALVFSSKDGALVTVNDLTVAGEMQSAMFGNYVSGNAAEQSKHNTVANNVNIVGTEVVSLSSGISPALSIYGKATLNNCNVYGTTLSKMDTDPMWPVYDVALVNYTDVTLNGGKYGSLYAWNQAKLTVDGAEVDSIVMRGNMNTTNYGVTIKAGSTVNKIDLTNITDKNKVNFTIDDSVKVKFVDNGVSYDSLSDWQAAQ